MYPNVILKPGKEQSVKRLHPWIFSGALSSSEGNPQAGDLVALCDSKKNILGFGHAGTGSIAVRMLHFGNEFPENFWSNAIEKAVNLRKQVLRGDTNCYRLIHGEGDGLPGLVIDVYDTIAVIQFHDFGMYLRKEELTSAIRTHLPGIKGIVSKSSDTLQQPTPKDADSVLWGEIPESLIVKENGVLFQIQPGAGQKTGFFLDQRDNRKLLGEFASGKKVLNCFSYTGGFSLYALKNGAISAVSADISKKATDTAHEQALLNGFTETQHQPLTVDCIKYLSENELDFDLVILDPPAFAKSVSKRHNATMAYKRINALAMKKMPKDSILFTFSCSQVVDRELFESTVMAAAIEAGRNIQILHRLTQPADHPVSIFHPEGSYLKGLVLHIQ